ncbi:MAG: EAL domain-containing protein [Spirochaetia bacterium]|nr:EAL domain-containing protein [Spirochaetia bacterium]
MQKSDDEKLRVMLVEDEPVTAIMTKKMLDKAGCNVDVFYNAEDALDAFIKEPYNIIFSDWILPKMNGIDLCREIRKLGARNTIIIIVTSIDEKDKLQVIVEAGADDYIRKPIEFQKLFVRLKFAQQRYAIRKEKNTLEQALRESLEALHESEERYALAAKGANDGLWDWNISNETMFFSARWKNMLGYHDSEIKNSINEWYELLHPEDKEQVKLEIERHIIEDTPNFNSEYRIKHKDGSYRWMLSRGLAVKNNRGDVYRMVGSQTDITERKMAEEQIMHDAFHDGLTGLANRTLLIDHIGLAIEKAKRDNKHKFSVMVVDMDRFNIINETFGHSMGDYLLKEISERLKTCMRPGDTIARLGGDEFAILLDDINDKEDASVIAEKIQNILKIPFSVSNEEVYVSASMGISLNKGSEIRPEIPLQEADAAMHIAKKKGASMYHFHSYDKERDTRAKISDQTNLRKALENNELSLNFQPQYNMSDKKIIGSEVLVRWKHPQKGEISPQTFISIAEESGFIYELTDWIIEQACIWYKSWLDKRYDFTISINFSASQFQREGMVKNFLSILEKYKISPSCFEIEITENMLMGKSENILETLLELKNVGVRFAIDDFGTGYSSLSYLKRFPISVIKIDKSFINGIPSDNENASIVKAIIAIANSLNLSVIAEGVENINQAEFLIENDCKVAQGYYFNRPLTPEKFEKVLEKAREEIVQTN